MEEGEYTSKGEGILSLAAAASSSLGGATTASIRGAAAPHEP